jgi:hypothetical protein
MARSRVANRGDGLQIWRLGKTILNKKSMTADRGWSTSLGVGEGLTTSRSKNHTCYEMLHRGSDLDEFFGTILLTYSLTHSLTHYMVQNII